MSQTERKLAVVTGASSGIGLELSRTAARDGFDLVIAADQPTLEEAAAELREQGVVVDAMRVDLSTLTGVQDFVQFIRDKAQPVDVLIANAGIDKGHAFLDQTLEDGLQIIDTNIRGTTALIHILAKDMKSRGSGRILVTSSIVGLMPGPFHAVYAASKAFLHSFSMALHEELRDTGVTVTCLMPGPTDTPIYERADMLDTAVGQAGKADPAKVAEAGFAAMMNGERDVVPGLMNKVLTVAANVVPSGVLTAVQAAATRPRK